MDPNRPGTEILSQIRSIQPLVRAVMLSGKAKSADYQAAIREGFNDFVDKVDVERLAEVVRQQYEEYLLVCARSAERAPTRLLAKRHYGPSILGPAMRAELLRMDSSISERDLPIAERDWTTIVKIDAGQTRRVLLSQTVERSLLVESETIDKLSASAALKDGILSELRTSIEQSVRSKAASQWRETDRREVEETFTLTEEGVRSREYQRAPVYHRYTAHVRISCECCGVQQHSLVPVLIWSGRFSYRQVDFREDGTVATHITG